MESVALYQGKITASSVHNKHERVFKRTLLQSISTLPEDADRERTLAAHHAPRSTLTIRYRCASRSQRRCKRRREHKRTAAAAAQNGRFRRSDFGLKTSSTRPILSPVCAPNQVNSVQPLRIWLHPSIRIGTDQAMAVTNFKILDFPLQKNERKATQHWEI